MSGQSDWIYQSISEVELRQKGRESIIQSKAVSNPNNVLKIEKLIFDLSLQPTDRFNRKKYVCLIQEFIRDTCFLKHKTVNEVYKLYQETLHDPSKNHLGWNSSLFNDCRQKEELEIYNLKNPVDLGTDGFYECPRCHQKNTRSISKQIRSADEPETEIVFCMNPICNFKWRI